MNTFVLSGRIGNDIDLATTKSGKKVVRFSLYVKGRGNRQAEDFHDYRFDIVAYDAHAENLAKYKKKGDWVLVQGYCYQSSYENYKKELINSVQFYVQDVDYGPPPPTYRKKKEDFVEETGEDDDFPF